MNHKYEGAFTVEDKDVVTTATEAQLETGTDLSQDLEAVKVALHEQSEAEGRIVDLGTLSGGQHEELWNQGENAISRKRRIASDEITEQEVETAVTRLSGSFVPVTKSAPKRCVDGSTIAGYSEIDPKSYGRALGPQVQGGTADEAIAARMTKGVTEEATHLGDIDAVHQERKSEFAEGDHTDDHANEQKSGCGAIDGQPRKLPMYNDPEIAPILEGTANTLLDLANLQPKEGSFEHLQESARQLEGRSNYFARPQEVLAKLLELSPNGLETLVRPHGEVSVTVNFVRNTTFHRDHYNAATGNKIQNFNLDAWVIIDEYGEDGYALIVDAVATLMDLTDGSLRLFARLPAEGQSENALPQAA